MGQRLVVSIESMGECLAKIYYHWSAYTISALYETQKIVNRIYNHNDETKEELMLRLIRFCEANGGGIDGNESEFNYIQGLYPDKTLKKDGYSRNNGIIALSKKGMEEMQRWSEGDVTIDIDEDVIHCDVCNYYESLLEYNEARAEWDEEWGNGIPLKKVPDIGYDLANISVDELDDMVVAIVAADSHVVRCGNDIFELVE